MLGLRYLTCPDCRTVYAVPGNPDDPGGLDECDRCGAAGLDALPSDPTAVAYFADALGTESEQ